MTDQLISIEIARLAKEKGFNEFICTCGGFPDCICESLPPRSLQKWLSQSLLQKWLREKHNIHMATKYMNNGFVCNVQISLKKSIKLVAQSTYEEALEQALIEGLKFI